MTIPPALSQRFDVEIHDSLGYTKDTFDFEELPKSIRLTIMASPTEENWTCVSKEIGTWKVARHSSNPVTPVTPTYVPKPNTNADHVLSHLKVADREIEVLHHVADELHALADEKSRELHQRESQRATFIERFCEPLD